VSPIFKGHTSEKYYYVEGSAKHLREKVKSFVCGFLLELPMKEQTIRRWEKVHLELSYNSKEHELFSQTFTRIILNSALLSYPM